MRLARALSGSVVPAVVDGCCLWRCREGCCRHQVMLPHWRHRHRGRCGVTGGADGCRCIGQSGHHRPEASRVVPGAVDATWLAGAVAANRHAGQSRRARATPDGQCRCAQTTSCAAGTGHPAAGGGRRCSSAPMPSVWETALRVPAQPAVARNARRAVRDCRSRCRDHRSRSFLFSGGIAP